jgi:hypothetical protein
MSNGTRQSDIRAGQRRLSGAAGIMALALLALAALPLLSGAAVRLVALLSYPYPHDGLEGTLLHEARLLWSGAALYQPLDRFSFVSAPYPPLHPLILGLADKITGPHVFWFGRLVSMIAALGVAVLIVLTVWRTGATWLGGLIGACLFLSAPAVLLWATRIKPDLTAMLWTALGLFLATCATTDNRRIWRLGRSDWQSRADDSQPAIPDRQSLLAGRWLLVAACFVLAFFTKQTDVAAPLAVGLALLIADLRAFYGVRERSGYIWRFPMRWRTLIYGLSYLVLALGIWALLDIVTGGQYTAHVWGLHRGEWWSSALLSKFVALLAPYWPMALLALLLFIRAVHTGRGLVPACYTLIVPISLLGAGETGANHNHLLETLLALSLAAGIVSGWMAELVARQQPAALLVLGLLAAQIALAYRPQDWYLNELTPNDPPTRYLAFIRATPGEILADDVGLLYAAGRALRYDDPSTMGPAAQSGIWDQSGLLQEIAERRFSAILLPVNVERSTIDASGRWTPEMLAAIRAHYQLKFRDTIFTYVPK